MKRSAFQGSQIRLIVAATFFLAQKVIIIQDSLLQVTAPGVERIRVQFQLLLLLCHLLHFTAPTTTESTKQNKFPN